MANIVNNYVSEKIRLRRRKKIIELKDKLFKSSGEERKEIARRLKKLCDTYKENYYINLFPNHIKVV